MKLMLLMDVLRSTDLSVNDSPTPTLMNLYLYVCMSEFTNMYQVIDESCFKEF